MFVSNIFSAIVFFDFLLYSVANNSFWPPKILKPDSKLAVPKTESGKDMFASVGDKKKCMENSCQVFKTICGENGICEQQDVEGSCQFSCRCYHGFHGVYCEFRDSDKETKGKPISKVAVEKPVVPPALFEKARESLSSQATLTTTLESETTPGMTTTSQIISTGIPIGLGESSTAAEISVTAGTTSIFTAAGVLQKLDSQTDQSSTTSVNSKVTSLNVPTEVSAAESKMSSTQADSVNLEATTDLPQTTENWFLMKESTSKESYQQKDSTVTSSSSFAPTKQQPSANFVSGKPKQETTFSTTPETTPVVTNSKATKTIEKFDLMKILKNSDSSNLNR